jgi:hypothetical protein
MLAGAGGRPDYRIRVRPLRPRAIAMATKHRSGPRSRRRGARDCLGPGATVRRDARLGEEEGLKVSAKRPLAHSKRGAGSVCGAGSVYPRLTQSRAFGPTVMIASRPKAWRDPPKEGSRPATCGPTISRVTSVADRRRRGDAALVHGPGARHGLRAHAVAVSECRPLHVHGGPQYLPGPHRASTCLQLNVNRRASHTSRLLRARTGLGVMRPRLLGRRC